jgi:hypothetical protein
MNRERSDLRLSIYKKSREKKIKNKKSEHHYM